MRTHRAPALLPPTLVALLLVPLGAPPASAQEPGGVVALTLERQTPIARPQEPEVVVEVRARNEGDVVLEDLGLRLSLWPALPTRSELEEWFLAGTPGVTPIDVRPVALDGSLEPGEERVFGAELSLGIEGVTIEDSFVYPITAELLSADVPVASLRSAAVYVVRRPIAPMRLATTIVLHEPLYLGIDEVFYGAGLEHAVLPEGRIAEAVAALHDELIRGQAKEPSSFAVNLVVSPPLLLQLRRMVDGYRVDTALGERDVRAGEGGAAAAEKVLGQLREIVGSERVELSSFTFAASALPSLVELAPRDFGTQLDRGEDLVESVLGTRPARSVTYPLGSAVDQDTIKRLAARGTRTLLLSSQAAPQATEQPDFAPPATASIERDEQDDAREALIAVVAQPSVQALLASEAAVADPVLAAQRALCTMAVIWRELPSVERPIAVAAPELAAPEMVPALTRRLSDAPFLHPTTAGRLVDQLPPEGAPVELVPLDERTFPEGYAASLKQSRRKVFTYDSMLVQPSDEPERLAAWLLLAEGAQFLSDPESGGELIGRVSTRVEDVFGKVRPIASTIITLTSRNGRIPVRVTNATGEPLEVAVELVSEHLSVGGERSQRLLLDEPVRTIEFDVALKTTGAFPVRVVVRAPGGRPISETTISVRSTAYNRVALIITIGAALVLLALWARRYSRSRRTS